MGRIDVGDPAPDLSLSTHTGEQLSLADYRGEHPVVVFFYPKDGTAVCTKEACSFRDAYEDFLAARRRLMAPFLLINPKLIFVFPISTASNIGYLPHECHVAA